MRHRRRRRRLGLVMEHRRALLRNLARGLITHQQIVTTHARAKETARFVDHLVTLAKCKTLHARRLLIHELGSGSEALAKRMMETVAPKFSDRNGGYTRVFRYKDRVGDCAQLALLEFSVPIEIAEKKPKLKKKKEPKPTPEVKKKEESKKAEAPVPKEEPKQKEQKGELKKETPKKGGFLSTLRRFLKGDEGKK